MSAELHYRSPDLGVVDPRGLGVRQIAYHRAQLDDSAAARLTLSRHDASGRRTRHWDPRLSARLATNQTVSPNQSTLCSLSGQMLIEENADAGWQLLLPGVAGEPRQRWDARASHWAYDYDEQLRPLAVHARLDGEPPRTAERHTWGGPWDEAANRCGRLIRQDDDVGSLLLQSYALTGQVMDETRHFLTDLDLPDWPETQGDRDALLEPGDGALTHSRHGPVNNLIEQTDALGNRQQPRVSQAGELIGLDLVLADGSTHPLLVEARYNAQGQIETRTAGNGVVSHAEYDPANARLLRLSARRAQRGSVQDLRYHYDPVGNLLGIEDLAQPTLHFANQKTEPVSTFGYDTLYQLIEASGREVSQGASHGPALPDLQPLPSDPSRMANYVQHYDYDAAGNLLHLRHVGSQSFTRDYQVADDSNHCLPPELTRAGFDEAFDARGNLCLLQRGQSLTWNTGNQLHRVTTLERDEQSDGEHYRYDSNGQRCRKTALAQAKGRTLVSEVRYLPGLELRRTATGEVLQVITCQALTGDVRVLHWQDGKPEGIDNDQIRYSLTDHLGSSALELDQNGALISQEQYYPFGGTAWWAGRSAVEAGYKTVRYSGKERDASGLYDYGFRYYAPWLQRWISPDPAGDVDGLNRYGMVGNNPVSFVDNDGLVGVGAGISDAFNKFERAERAGSEGNVEKIREGSRDLIIRVRGAQASRDTQTLRDQAKENSKDLAKLSESKKALFLMRNPGMLTEKRLEALTAHAAVTWNLGMSYRSGFFNLPGSLSPKNLFPGVDLKPEAPKSDSGGLRLHITPAQTNSYFSDRYYVSDINALIGGVHAAYRKAGTRLHPYTEHRIRLHINANKFWLRNEDGIPGLHAEVVAINKILLLKSNKEKTDAVLRDAIVFTERLAKGNGQLPGAAFPACYNCSGILSSTLFVPTGVRFPHDKTPDTSKFVSRAGTPPF